MKLTPGRVAAVAAPVLLVALPAASLGHAPLLSSTPEAGAELDEAPPEVTMTFDGELDPAGSGFTVTDADGALVGSGDVDLEVADRNVLAGEVTVESPGAYTVSWESVAADGHAESGAFSFTVAARPGATPDTALKRPSGPGSVVLAGITLVLAGALLVVGRVATARRGTTARVPVALTLALLLGACLPDTGPDAELCEPSTVELEVAVTERTLTPSNLAVCREQEVTLVVTADEPGVFHIHGYDEAVPATQLSSEEPTRISFTADRSGQFPIELHPEEDPRGVEIGVLTVHER